MKLEESSTILDTGVKCKLLYMAGLLKYARQKPSSYCYRTRSRSHKFSHVAGDHVCE